jgi:hypothetical protein
MLRHRRQRKWRRVAVSSCTRRCSAREHQTLVLEVARYVSQSLGQEGRFGTVAAGNRADPLPLQANPLDGLSNLHRRAGVMVRGRWLPASAIDAALSGIAAKHAPADQTPAPAEAARERGGGLPDWGARVSPYSRDSGISGWPSCCRLSPSKGVRPR